MPSILNFFSSVPRSSKSLLLLKVFLLFNDTVFRTSSGHAWLMPAMHIRTAVSPLHFRLTFTCILMQLMFCESVTVWKCQWLRTFFWALNWNNEARSESGGLEDSSCQLDETSAETSAPVLLFERQISVQCYTGTCVCTHTHTLFVNVGWKEMLSFHNPGNCCQMDPVLNHNERRLNKVHRISMIGLNVAVRSVSVFLSLPN
jgi:hypothetical protein